MIVKSARAPHGVIPQPLPARCVGEEGVVCPGGGDMQRSGGIGGSSAARTTCLLYAELTRTPGLVGSHRTPRGQNASNTPRRSAHAHTKRRHVTHFVTDLRCLPRTAPPSQSVAAEHGAACDAHAASPALSQPSTMHRQLSYTGSSYSRKPDKTVAVSSFLRHRG